MGRTGTASWQGMQWRYVVKDVDEQGGSASRQGRQAGVEGCCGWPNKGAPCRLLAEQIMLADNGGKVRNARNDTDLSTRAAGL